MFSKYQKILFGAFLALILTACREENPLYLYGYTYGDFIYLSYDTPKKISQVMVKKGDMVKKEQALVKADIFTAENKLGIAEKKFGAEVALLKNLQRGARIEEVNVIQAQIARAKSAVDLAKLQLDRNQNLTMAQAVSLSELDRLREDYLQKKAQLEELSHQLQVKKLPARQDEIDNQAMRVEAARLELEQSQWELKQNILFAPVNAQVFDVIYKPGEYAAGGKPVISLLSADNIKFRFFIPEKQLGAIHIGTKVNVFCDSCQAGVVGRIDYIKPEAEFSPPMIYSTKRREKMIYMAEARMISSSFDSVSVGQPVRVEIISDE